MEVSWMSSKFYRTCEWIWRLAYVNLLWLFATLLGLVVFGIFPATAAMFAVIRKWFMGDPDVSIFKTFTASFRKEFIKANVLGMILIGIGYLIYFNVLFLGTLSGAINLIFSIALLFASLMYLVTALFLFPVFVQYELKLLQYFKVAFIIGVVNPLALITLLISLGLISYLLYLIPGLIPFFSMSMYGVVFTWCASMAFSRAALKQEKVLGKEAS